MLCYAVFKFYYVPVNGVSDKFKAANDGSIFIEFFIGSNEFKRIKFLILDNPPYRSFCYTESNFLYH